jgi:hypothetical protein
VTVEVDPRWPGVLDALEADALRLLTVDPTEVGAFYRPPADLGPLPSALRSRAEHVVEVLASSSVSLDAQLAAVRSELARIERSQRVGEFVPARRGAFEALA